MSDNSSQQDGLHGSTPRQRLYRISTLKDFLPLSSDPVLPSRNQGLPGLISSRSQTNIAALRGQRMRRRRSSAGDDDPPRGSQESERPRDLEAGRRGTFNESNEDWMHDRRMSNAASVLMTPQMRSQRLIGNSNPRYRWEKYWKKDEDLKNLPKPLRQYYERCNFLVQRYLYVDRLLDSSLPQSLIQEYDHVQSAPAANHFSPSDVPPTITEEPMSAATPTLNGQPRPSVDSAAPNGTAAKVKRTPKDMYRIKSDDVDETAPLLQKTDTRGEELVMPPDLEEEEEADSQSRIVTIAIIVNTIANTILLGMKIAVAVLTSSVSVLASLVDAALDWLSTMIIWTTTHLIANTDQYAYPIGRRRLEPVGVMVFAVIMITSFAQVAIEGIQKLVGTDHSVVQLSTPAIIIMASTVVIKGACWLWCRLIKNSSVQALAQDAVTDVIFNTFSIIFPLVGYYASIWWLDALGGVVLSIYVIFSWSGVCLDHIRKLTGCAATADERNVLLYLTMRFAKTIKQIQGLQAYHAGDKLNVEVDIVLDEGTSLKDSHDLGESLQYVLESVPNVDRAFVHLDYAGYNLPSHMQQDS
ncbi:hypothetical protein LTR91_006710 [Friedmanniomyces endolithicus]|uniref:Cation efflux protein transmembrane domain-containing protein n=1 Tax=Friedmanniomyces endolithicus TaxID=329885 RepID=A0AAN6KRH2_9PEZI|nr:hypothetical protein LTR57_013461 [Friedmanniomyces endolithicus]KAK0973350.1 hypothetical protein LTS01_014615 [Friedmanniomyces endolithicus]KAK0997271.1 hypothetical protein LTR91_006710 [Friedmanniomyces endolithicus]KAK1027249.1 hypothetical protein LTS16_021648 [Friedmanniomyces endolithicus]